MNDGENPPLLNENGGHHERQTPLTTDGYCALAEKLLISEIPRGLRHNLPS